MRARIVAVLMGAAGVAFGCSAVPDVRFADDGGTNDGGANDAGDAGDVIPPSCPDNPPSGAICCNKTICEGCTDADCAGCETAGCGAGDVCCPVGASGKITCKPATCR